MSEPYSFVDDLVDWDEWTTFEQPEPDSAALDQRPGHQINSLMQCNIGILPVRLDPGLELLSQNHLEHLVPCELLNQPNIDNILSAPSPHQQNEIDSDHQGFIQVPAAPAFPRAIYTQTTCASCDTQLDTSEQDLGFIRPNIYCTSNQGTDHLHLVCGSDGCEEKFSDIDLLKKHCHKAKHETFRCSVPTCQQFLTGDDSSIEKHFKQHPEIKFHCFNCGLGFDTFYRLDWHCWGQSDQHARYRCPYPGCEIKCQQRSDMRRHQIIHKIIAPSYPCNHCRTYRGKNGFKRKDHLRQHIRNYHKIEDHYHCSQGHKFGMDTGMRGPWTSLEEFTDHMLQIHQRSPYICNKWNCDRKGMDGFATDRDLKSHIKNDHPPPFQCSYPGCDRVGSKGWRRKVDMVKHMAKKHGQGQNGNNFVQASS